jgi:hypothetical protein
MEWLAVVVALVGAGIAVCIPLAVEYARRPELAVELADDLNIENRTPNQRIVHVRVVNRPLQGLRARWLLRNAANGCKVHVKFVSHSDQSGPEFDGRWSGHPEPYTLVAIPGPTGGVAAVPWVQRLSLVDEAKIPQTRVIDVSPGTEGQVVGIAIKTDDYKEAYGFGPESYLYEAGHLQNPQWFLPHTTYDVQVFAEAGELRSPIVRFVLRNEGTSHTGLTLGPPS